MDDFFSHYQDECIRFGFSASKKQPSPRFFSGAHLQMNCEIGNGWAEILQIDNGLYVGRCDYRLKKDVHSFHGRVTTPLQFHVLLEGLFTVQFPGKPEQIVGPGDVWFGHSRNMQVSYSMGGKEDICGLSIGLPISLVENWLGSANIQIDRGLEQFISRRVLSNVSAYGNFIPLVKNLPESTSPMQIARELLVTRHQTIFDKLHFESLTLELLAQLFALDVKQFSASKESQRIWPAIDMAMEIRCREWATPPTISTLARRVGLNECYLKREFRSRTGLSIGEYIRKLRMSNALKLLETGKYSIMEIALATGYANPSHFSAAFKKFYGETPSRYRYGHCLQC